MIDSSNVSSFDGAAFAGSYFKAACLESVYNTMSSDPYTVVFPWYVKPNFSATRREAVFGASITA